jgi:AhpD family alkylhydroperoxidase
MHAIQSELNGPARARLHAKEREQIALTVAQANLCESSLTHHTAIARKVGLTDDQILASREGWAADQKVDVALRFARALVANSGDWPHKELKRAGFTDQEIVEIEAVVALNVYENYFNIAATGAVRIPRRSRLGTGPAVVWSSPITLIWQ